MLEAMAHFAIEPFAASFRWVPRRRRATVRGSRRLTFCARPTRASSPFTCRPWRNSGKDWWLALDAPELASDERFRLRQSRIDNYEALNSELDRRFARLTLSEWIERLSRYDVPHAPINTVDEVVHDPQVEHLGLIVPVAGAHDALRSVRPPVRFGGVRARSVRAAPLLNEHGDSIRASIAGGEQWPPAQRTKDLVDVEQ